MGLRIGTFFFAFPLASHIKSSSSFQIKSLKSFIRHKLQYWTANYFLWKYKQICKNICLPSSSPHKCAQVSTWFVTSSSLFKQNRCTHDSQQDQNLNEVVFLIARMARSNPRNSFVVSGKKILCAIYSILVYFVMFSFQVLTCLRIVSIRIILILNKFRHA